MAKKQPYTITEHADKTVTLTIAGISQRFADKNGIISFAEQLYEQTSCRYTGFFRLQDTENGGVDMIINRSGDIIHAKDSNDLLKLADKILEQMYGE